ncbi:MAG: MOSC domain-containing protein [Cytophagales bacterium]|nr:MOSC domain-containing protein [Armatimonadota bacterium]
MPRGQIRSLQVSLPKTLTTAGKTWTSAIAKEPVDTPLVLRRENLEGDYQANRKYHGGPDKALCGYCAEHYPYWSELLGQEMPFGAFGENLTVAGLTEDMLCIGDVLEVGEGGVLIQVSQPRQPCANVSKRWSRPDLPRRMEQTGWTGFYTRVIATGSIAPGDPLVLQERPHPGWTILRANTLMYAEVPDREAVAVLRSLPALSPEWKRILGRKMARSG